MRKRRVIRTIILSVIIASLVAGLVGWLRHHFMRAAPAAVKSMLPQYQLQIVRWFAFSQENALKEWEEKLFKGRVVYKVERTGDLNYVRAQSDKSASALYYKIRLDTKTKHPMIRWRWCVKKFPAKKATENLSTQDEDDFAARVYVIFPHGFVTNWKVLEYLWAEHLPQGMTGVSPYSPNIKLFVVRSGDNPKGEWQSEERDINADYLATFGRLPPCDVGAIAFMTNAEHTQTSADALYDDIQLGYREDAVSGANKEGTPDARSVHPH